MLVIRTGKPGHGKTLNTIKEVDEQACKSGRVIYYHNINGLKPDLMQADWYEFEDPTKWYELPHNSIIVIDEAQTWFGSRDPRNKPDPHLTAFETMRHSGFEVHLITQDPRFLHTHARRLANIHVHFSRVMKSTYVLRFESETVIDKVETLASFKDADKSRIKLDSKFFDKYTSSNADHHFKFQPSKKLIISLIVIIVTIFLIFRVYSLYSSKTADLATPAAAIQELSLFDSPIIKTDEPKPKKETKPELDYFAKHVPRIKNLPHTAPIYDELTAPVTYPKLSCIAGSTPAFLHRLSENQIKDGIGCSCYTQQATPVNTDFEFCLTFLQHGIFDHAQPDSGQQLAKNKDKKLSAGRLAF